MTNSAAPKMDVVAQNMGARAALIATGLKMMKQLQPVVAPGLGQQVRIPLDRMGITTGVMLDVQIPVTITGTATASPFAPYNLVQLLTYTDYSGLNRHLTGGFQLHALNCFRGQNLSNNAVNGAFLVGTESGLDTNILSMPTAAGSATIRFQLYIPLAIDPNSDLRGAVLSQTIYGDHYITVQLPPQLVGTDSYVCPYTGASTVVVDNTKKIVIQAYQNYIMPQQGVQNLPMIDLSTIYAIEGGTTDTANIAAGQSKYVNWPNNRAILSALHVFDNGGAVIPNGTDVNRIVLLGNGNTNIREMSVPILRNQMRYALGADLPPGVYYIPSRMQPITTQLYGNVQTQFDIQTANAGAYFSSQYESTYLSGTPLPGIIQ